MGLREAIEDPTMTCFTCPCHLQPGLSMYLRDQKLENHSVVERACVLGHFDMLELFLQNGCSANLPTSHGRLIHTVLTSLKSHRHLIENGMALNIIKLLITRDCDVNVKDYLGKSPLLLAAELADADIMRQILKCCLDWQLTCPSRGNGHTPLHMASMNGSVECVSLLLVRLSAEDLNAEDRQSFTPLLCSLIKVRNNMAFHNIDGTIDSKLLQVQYSHVAIIELLLSSGAKVSNNLTTPFTQTKSRSGLHIALEIVNQFELKKRLQNLRFSNEMLVDAFSVHVNQLTDDAEGDKKLLSPYAEIVRMLVYYCGVSPYETEELLLLRNTYPCVSGLLREIDEYVQRRKLPGAMCLSLLNSARVAIRLHIARCDKLSLLDQLPVPHKLRDYVKFVDL
ncbi:unnamed protein product [Candidula unifasciata]|uniref:SOCS box domain-containing protein n=1 Tax=Candidula unifasciata TaxID=100452 RepID=A0A8S3YZB0_9EUPU|nr:unnamed protein product [Candidula unifasciata]